MLSQKGLQMIQHLKPLPLHHEELMGMNDATEVFEAFAFEDDKIDLGQRRKE